MFNKLTKMLLLPAAAAVLVACGGGSTVSSPLAITGTAAFGAPLSGATVKVYDATGTLVVSDGTVRSDGSYALTIPAGKQAPFVFIVNDGDQQYVSVLSDTSQTTVNITPLSNFLASTLSVSGNPENLVAEIAAKTTQINSTNYAAKVNALRAVLAPVLSAAGVTTNSFDPVSSAFSANGTGIDKVLDVLDVAITPSQTTANVELTVKVSLNEDDINPANVIKFQASADTTISGTLPALTAADLPADGTSILIQELLDKLTACYQQPVTSRISLNGTTAANITAQACKPTFLNEDPSLYLSSGSKVGKTGHFGGIFTALVPVTFDRPKFFGAVRTSQSNGPQAGDMLIGYRWKDENGNFQYERSMVRKTNTTPAKLEIVGNGYLYESSVTPYAQLRQFVQNNDRDYRSVGYSPYVARRLYDYTVGGVSKQKYISTVVVTTPSQRQILLCNRTGYSFLVMAKQVATPTCANDTDKTGTSFIRIASEYTNKATDVNNHPRLKDTSVAFVGTDWSDDQIEEAKTYAAWKFDFVFKDTVTNSVVGSTETQWHRPPRRVHSLREFKKIPLPSVTPTMLESMKTAISPVNTVGSGLIQIPADGVQVSWKKAYENVNGVVPEDAVPMTAIRIFGKYDNNGTPLSFEDRMVVRSNSNQATIKCPSGTEAQCSATGSYRATTTQKSGYSGLDLWSRGPDGVEYVNFYATYLISP